MVNLNQNIQIGSVVFNAFANFEATDSVDDVGGGGTITIPKDVALDGKDLSELISKGDLVTVNLGYNEDLPLYFKGVVSSIHIDKPIMLELDGFEWYLSQVNVKKIFNEGVTSKEIMTFIINEVNNAYNTSFELVVTANFEKLPEQRYNNVSCLQVVNSLRSSYGIYSYFRGEQLFTGLKYPEFEDKESFKFYLDGQNCNVVSNDLKYQKANEIRVLCKGTSYVTKDNELKKITVEVGDKGGRTIPYQGYNLTESQLKVKCQDKLNEYKKDGYTGGITVFGTPKINHGDVIELISEDLPERNGKFLVKGVKSSCSVSGGLRQVVELDLKV